MSPKPPSLLHPSFAPVGRNEEERVMFNDEKPHSPTTMTFPKQRTTTAQQQPHAIFARPRFSKLQKQMLHFILPLFAPSMAHHTPTPTHPCPQHNLGNFVIFLFFNVCHLPFSSPLFHFSNDRHMWLPLSSEAPPLNVHTLPLSPTDMAHAPFAIPTFSHQCFLLS
jgi:hypothetical protein